MKLEAASREKELAYFFCMVYIWRDYNKDRLDHTRRREPNYLEKSSLAKIDDLLVLISEDHPEIIENINLLRDHI